MQRDLEKLLEEVEEGQGFKIPDDLSRIASRINSQERYTVDMGKKGRLHLGENFERNADEIGQTMGFVLQAVDYGYREEVEIEKLTLLISAARHPVQVRCWLRITVGKVYNVHNASEYTCYCLASLMIQLSSTQILHSDQDPKKLGTNLRTEGSGTRARSEPAPLSGLFAFMGGTVLHVISKNHLDAREGYDWVDAEEVITPCGWAIIFHSCLIHAGGSFRFNNGRMRV